MTAIPLQPCHECPELSRRRAALAALSDATQWVLAKLREWRRRDRDRRALAALDDHALADIGLSRSQAEFLANKPFWRE